ncbi:uncharacterized protein LOC124810815 isoform X1 [Hydra vulgaris]|uniref:uncharacterized protein LOC124810815 isoform X1 n=1 Tax=Hydra vulgaris TaxID=6087 RepID=UPI001F5E9012|nr:uncharacterized protein LOC124810815 [Hydra vulgaris]
MDPSAKFFFLLVLIIFSAVDCDYCEEYGFGTGERSYRCLTNIENFPAEINIDIKTCNNDPVVKFHIKISKLNINFETQVHASQDIQIPGLSLSSLAGLYIQVNFEDDHSGNKDIKVMLLFKVFKVVKLKLQLLNKTISNSNCNDILKMWNSADDSLKYGITGGLSLLLVGLFSWCCYCCCRKKKAKPAIIMSGNILPLFQSKIPYKIHNNV